MNKPYSVAFQEGIWQVIHRGGDVIARSATREAAQSNAESANSWAAVATTLGVEGAMPKSVIKAFV